MKKDQLIAFLLEFMAPVVNPREEGNEEPAPQVAFLSQNEVQVCDRPGENLPTNLDCSGNTLANALWKIVNYDYPAEEKHYLESLYEEDEEAAEAFDEKEDYNPELVPGHIYHTLRFIKELLEAYEGASGDTSYRDKETQT